MHKDMPVAVFPFTEVPNLMIEFGANPNSKKKDGHKKGYRKSEVLTNMAVADYGDDVLLSLCEIYKMNAIGMSTKCETVMKFD